MVNGHVLKSHFRLLLFIIYCLPWQLVSICVNIPAWTCKHILTKLQIIPTEQLTIPMITYRKNPGNNNNLLLQMNNSNLQNMCIFITYIVAWMKIKSHTGVYCSPVIIELVHWRFLFLKKDAAKVLECFHFGDVYSFFFFYWSPCWSLQYFSKVCDREFFPLFLSCSSVWCILHKDKLNTY